MSHSTSNTHKHLIGTTTAYCVTPNGIVAIRGWRVLHLYGTSESQIEKSRELLATESFNKLFQRGHHCGRNCAYLHIRAEAT